MRDIPILFSAPMVRALLDGSKTQTRRLAKPTSGRHSIEEVISTPDSLAAFIRHRCPYGAPGDRLWVRESASRITLEVTGVRVERLQDISLRDARAEGCEVREFWLFGADATERQRIGAGVYRSLWESINGAGSWDVNPYVWVIEFRRL